MKKDIRILTLALVLIFNQFAFAADPKEAKADTQKAKEALDSIDYPELQVVPRASERLAMEAYKERENPWMYNWNFLTTGLSTVAIGTMHNGRTTDTNNADKVTSSKNATMMAQSIGLFTLAAGTYLSLTQPFYNSNEKLKSIKPENKRAIIQKERLSEETLETYSRNVKIVSWVASVANFMAMAWVTAETDNTIKPFALGGLLLSTLPAAFPSSYVNAYEKHLEYKRKIYSPLPTAYLKVDPRTGKTDSVTGFQWAMTW